MRARKCLTAGLWNVMADGIYDTGTVEYTLLVASSDVWPAASGSAARVATLPHPTSSTTWCALDTKKCSYILRPP